MSLPDSPDTRRLCFSLAVSLALNFGLLALVGWLGRARPAASPSGQPHLHLVAFSTVPRPAPSARRGIAAARPLTPPPRVVPRATRPRRLLVRARVARQPRPHVFPRPAAPRRLHVVTTEAPSARVVPLPREETPGLTPPVAPPPVQKPLTLIQGPPITLAPIKAAPIKLALIKVTAAALRPRQAPPLPSVLPIPAAAPALRVAASSRGAKSSGAGWTLGAGAQTGDRAGGPFGIGDGRTAGRTRHIVYVLDISGSMGSRIGRADEELEGALRGLHTGETFNIVAFSGGSRVFDPDMAEASVGAAQRAAAFLHGLEIGGDTNLEDAVTRALMLRDVNEVVVLTDGVPTVGETDFAALARTVRRLNVRHARISTIGLVGRNADGTDNSFEAASLLQEIARDSGGESRLVPLGVAAR